MFIETLAARTADTKAIVAQDTQAQTATGTNREDDDNGQE